MFVPKSTLIAILLGLLTLFATRNVQANVPVSPEGDKLSAVVGEAATHRKAVPVLQTGSSLEVPWPAKDSLTAFVEVRNPDHELVFSQSLRRRGQERQVSFSIGEMPAGMYTLSIQSGAQLRQVRFIVTAY